MNDKGGLSNEFILLLVIIYMIFFVEVVHGRDVHMF